MNDEWIIKQLGLTFIEQIPKNKILKSNKDLCGQFFLWLRQHYFRLKSEAFGQKKIESKLY